MKKVLWKIAAATLILTMTGCSNTATPLQSEDRPPPSAVESVLEPGGLVESEMVALSAGNDQFVDNTEAEEDTATEATTEPEPQAELPAAPQPREPQASVRASVTFVPDSKSETVENPSPAPSETSQETPQAPEPEPTPSLAPPAESEQPTEPAPPAASEPTEPTFSIDYWISYAQKYAGSVGLNLDSTAVDCWDNPIIAGAHCTYLERDIQSRLNRYAGDETILDVWVWAENRSDGNYDLYIGYA